MKLDLKNSEFLSFKRFLNLFIFGFLFTIIRDPLQNHKMIFYDEENVHWKQIM